MNDSYWPRILLVLTLGLALPSLAHEEYGPDERGISLSGFGTLGVVHNSTAGAEYMRDYLQPHGPADEWTLNTDSRFGVQLDARFNAHITMTVQGISKYSHDGDHDPELNLALISYEPTPELRLRAGRLGWDVYMLADSRDIGYSYVWVRPPADYYGKLLLTHIDGADAVYRRDVADGLLSLKAYGGFADQDVPTGSGGDLDLAGSWLAGANLTYRRGDWLWRADYARVEMNNDIPGYAPLLAGLRATGLPRAAELADDITLADAHIDIYSAGMTWEQGPWQAQLMYNRLDSNSLTLADAHSAYLLVAWRHGRWSPYFAASGTVTSKSDRTTGLPLPNPLDDAVRRALDLTHTVQHTFSAGVRYDVLPNVDIKLQVDRVHVYDNAAALWWDQQPGWDGDATLFSIALDFIF